jgi:hypothetical protein
MPTGIEDIPQAKDLKAWTIQNGTLHVSGLTAGRTWSVYSISGAVIYQNIANGAETEIMLTVCGVYIVKSEKDTVKVVYR